MNLGQDVNEDVVLEILNDNFKQINNYYNMIIENIYSNPMEISDKTNNISFENNILQKKIIYYKFPECLKINILKINDKKRSCIISDFFKNALNSIELYSIKEFKYFYNLYLNKSTDNLFIQQYFQNKRLYSLIPCPPYIQSNSDKNILPPINSEKYSYSLILDLDETLIHLEREYYTFNNMHNIKNKKLTLRPGLINFLEKMKKIYEIILFTFSPNDYADSIIDIIEKDEKYFEYKLYVQHASYNNGKYVKDINDLGRDIKNAIIVEDNINNVHKSNLDNTICIKPFYGECNNEKNTLQLLGNILNKVRYDAEITGDIRKSLAKEKYNIITEISSNLEE
jgi:Dullard-like phosphatase family protein